VNVVATCNMESETGPVDLGGLMCFKGKTLREQPTGKCLSWSVLLLCLYTTVGHLEHFWEVEEGNRTSAHNIAHDCDGSSML